MYKAVETINYFMSGSYKKADARMKPLNWLYSQYQEKGKEESLWSIQDLLEKAEAALQALSTSTSKEIEKNHKHNLYTKTHKEWADARLMGPYLPHSELTANSETIDTSMGLSDFVFVGIDRQKSKETEEESDYMFMEARRMTAYPEHVQPTAAGIPYELTLIYKFYDGLAPIVRYYTIKKNGEIVPCSVLTCRTSSVRKYRNVINIPVKKWVSDDIVFGDKEFTGASALSLAMNFYQQIELNWYLKVSDKRGSVNLSITPAEAKVLFKDRITMKAADGKKKRIIHWVKSHKRVTGANVKTHFRGEREFQWNGLDVEIKLPGKHTIQVTKMSHRTEVSACIIPWYLIIEKLKTKWINKKQDEFEKKSKPLQTVVNPQTGEKVEFMELA